MSHRPFILAALAATTAAVALPAPASANHRLLDCRDAQRSAAAPDTPCIIYCRIYDTTGEYPCGIGFARVTPRRT